jgi:hypothetical protein
MGAFLAHNRFAGSSSCWKSNVAHMPSYVFATGKHQRFPRYLQNTYPVSLQQYGGFEGRGLGEGAGIIEDLGVVPEWIDVATKGWEKKIQTRRKTADKYKWTGHKKKTGGYKNGRLEDKRRIQINGGHKKNKNGGLKKHTAGLHKSGGNGASKVWHKENGGDWNGGYKENGGIEHKENSRVEKKSRAQDKNGGSKRRPWKQRGGYGGLTKRLAKSILLCNYCKLT